jgi:hypothetical protein
MASDGKGYALTNNGEHLYQFTTNKKAVITDLGSLTDDVNNGAYSVHNARNYGGDMVADNKGKLYLITANKMIFKIDPESKTATYKGMINGLPRGYSTNGAVVEKGTSIIVSSANSTDGYYKFDLNTLQAEKLENTEPVYNASDLANSNFITADKSEDKNDKTTETLATTPITQELSANTVQNEVTVFPNPALAGKSIKISFNKLPVGKYTIQLLDFSGKMVSSREVRVFNSNQVEEYKLSSFLSKGNYVVKVVGQSNNLTSSSNIIVQ